MDKVIDHDQKIKLAVLEATIFWRVNLTNEAMQSYFQELKDLPADDVIFAIKLLKREPKQTQMPFPGQIRNKISPVLEDIDRARIVAGNIIEAISRVGPYRDPVFSDVEQRVVKCMGGWQNVCESIDQKNMNQMMAQIRDLALSIIRCRDQEDHRHEISSAPAQDLLSHLGVEDLLPKLPL